MVIDLTPNIIKAARALLAWTQGNLADASGVALSTVADFERGQRELRTHNHDAIVRALVNEGITFIDDGISCGVVLDKATHHVIVASTQATNAQYRQRR